MQAQQMMMMQPAPVQMMHQVPLVQMAPTFPMQQEQPTQPTQPTLNQSEAIAKALMEKVNMHATKKQDIPKPITSEPASDSASGAAARAAQETMNKAQEECNAAQAMLSEFQKELDSATEAALAAERNMERALDSCKELQEMVAALSNASTDMPPSQNDRIEQKRRQAEADLEQSQKVAQEAATNVFRTNEKGEIFRVNVKEARVALSNRKSEFTLAACRAAAEGSTEWMQQLDAFNTKWLEEMSSGLVDATPPPPAPVAPNAYPQAVAHPQLYASQPNVFRQPNVIFQSPAQAGQNFLMS